MDKWVSSSIKGSPSRPAAYCILLGLLLAATLLRYALSTVLGPNSPFITYLPIIVLGAWMIGFEGGLVATVVSCLVAARLFMPQPITVLIGHTNVTREELYIFEGLLISVLGHGQFTTRQRAIENAQISEKNAQLAKNREAMLADKEEQLRLVVDSANVGVWHWDLETDKITFSPKMNEILGISGSPPETFGPLIDIVHPDYRESFMASVQSSIDGKCEYNAEIGILWHDGSLHHIVSRGRTIIDSNDKPEYMQGIAIDITEIKATEAAAKSRARYSTALNEINKAIRETTDNVKLQGTALRLLSEALDLDRSLIILVDKPANKVRFVAESHRIDLPNLVGEYKLSDFHVDLDEIFRDSAPLVLNDVDKTTHLSESSSQMLRSLGIRSMIDVPFFDTDGVFAVLGVYMSEEVRIWTQEEISFVESVASQLRTVSETSRILAEANRRAELEALISRIGEELRSSLDPTVIQAKAANLLGESLQLDRCYFAVYDFQQKVVRISPDWHRPDLPSIQGTHSFANIEEMWDDLYSVASTSIITNRETAQISPGTKANMESLQIYARMSVAIAETTGRGSLTAVMSDGQREWTADEIILLEKVASKLRSAVEMARVNFREHRIATDLQTALQPDLPVSIPKMRAGVHMRPVLDEAEIGGDFYDVFPISSGKYALIIGDVSGKGLLAAGELATVRNSLRAALYIHSGPATAVTFLNGIITSNRLVKGFVTLFVGIVDVNSGHMTYTSCGHEPALLMRAKDRSIEQLSTHGLPLAVMSGATFTEQCISLENKDRIVLYTDGISEAGPNNSVMLDIAGVRELMTEIADIDDPTKAANHLVARAAQFANGNLRDDVCVLVLQRDAC